MFYIILTHALRSIIYLSYVRELYCNHVSLFLEACPLPIQQAFVIAPGAVANENKKMK